MVDDARLRLRVDLDPVHERVNQLAVLGLDTELGMQLVELGQTLGRLEPGGPSRRRSGRLVVALHWARVAPFGGRSSGGHLGLRGHLGTHFTCSSCVVLGNFRRACDTSYLDGARHTGMSGHSFWESTEYRRIAGLVDSFRCVHTRPFSPRLISRPPQASSERTDSLSSAQYG